MESQLCEVCETGDLQGLRQIIDDGYNVNTNRFFNPAKVLIKNGHHECLQLLLETVDYYTIEKDDLLFYAVALGQRRCCRSVLQLGADVNAVDMCGRTPLHYATWNMRMDCIGLLVRKGAVADK